MSSGASLFDRQAASYAQYRPSYPEEVYKIILKYCDFSHKPEQALDIATGSGQAAVALAEYFNKVIAIDSSIQQLKHAKQKDNVVYQKGLAENTGIPSSSMDLVAVAQALHWFDHPKFFAECARVLRPGGSLALWGYGLPTSPNHELSELIEELSSSGDQLGPYWAPERRHVDDQYENITPDSKFFDRVERKSFPSSHQWSIDGLIGYLSSWSPYSTWRHKHPEKDDLLIAFKEKALKACDASSGSHVVTIDFPIFFLLAKLKS